MSKKVNQNPYNMSSGLRNGKTLGDYDTMTGLDEAALRMRQRMNKKIGETATKFKNNVKQIPQMVRQTKATNTSIAQNNLKNISLKSSMPKKMERELKATAKKKGLKGERADAYIYGTMRKTGWVPSTQKKHKK
jgi:hypothetical protein